MERLELEEVIDRLAEYEGWEQEGGMLGKRFDFEDFSAAIDFVNEVADIAEDLDHHPDIHVQNYDTVLLNVTSHDAGGITDRDFELVGRVEDIEG